MTTAVVDRLSSVVNFRVSSCFVLVLVSVTFVLAALWCYSFRSNGHYSAFFVLYTMRI